MTDELVERLKPCPFCGGEAVAANYVIEAAVRCLSCQAKIVCSHGAYDDNGLPKAIAAWNTRTEAAGIQQLQARIEALEGEVRALKAAIAWIEPPFVDEATPESELRNRIQFCTADAKRAALGRDE